MGGKKNIRTILSADPSKCSPIGEGSRLSAASPILALDLGSKTGWATHDTNGLLYSGVEEFALRRGESTGMRFLRFKSWLGEVFARTAARVIAFEAAIPFHKSGSAGEVAFGFSAILQTSAIEAGVEYISVTASEIKKAATGKGNSPKPAMIEAAKRMFPEVRIVDDNHADALLLLNFAEGLLDPRRRI